VTLNAHGDLLDNVFAADAGSATAPGEILRLFCRGGESREQKRRDESCLLHEIVLS
jgi:hypothetical protein